MNGSTTDRTLRSPWALLGIVAVLGTALSSMAAQLPPGTTDAAERPAASRPEDPLRTRAAEALERRNYREAIAALNALLEKSPGDALLLYNLGSAQDALDQGSAAETSYRQAAAADARFLEPRLALGLLLARAGRLAEARTELLAAVALPSEDAGLRARAYRSLAHVDRTLNPAEARDAMLSALKLSPETPDDAVFSAALAGQMGDTGDAEAAYRRMLAAAPDDPDGTAGLAHLLVSTGKLEEAEVLLQSAAAKHPDDPEVGAQLAALYTRQNKLDEALTLAERLHATNPGDAALARMEARLLAAKARYAEAETIFGGLVKTNPTDGSLADAEADALIHLHRTVEAETLLSRVLAQPGSFTSEADRATAASHMAFAASINNHPEVVLQALQLRATFLPQSPSTLFLAATAHDRLHHVKQASELYKQFLAVADGKFSDEEWEARHRLVTLAHMR